MRTVDFLDLVVALGPIFAISRMIGPERTARLEKWLLEQPKRKFETARLLAHVGVSVAVLYLLLNIVGIVFQLLGIGASKIDNGSVAALPFVAVFFYLNFLLYQWSIRYSHRKIQQTANVWRQKCGVAPPWPLSSLEGTVRYQAIFWFQQTLFFWVIYFAIVAPLLYAVCAVAFTPFIAVERLRTRINPKAVSYLDLLAYLLSLLGIAIKYLKALM